MYEQNSWLYKTSLEANSKTFHNIDWIIVSFSLPFLSSYCDWVGFSCCVLILEILDILFPAY